MSDGYTKLFSSLIHSTVWQEDAFVKVVWITMLAMADRDGVVAASVPGLAKAAGVPLDACEAALAKFQQPDPYSRTPDNEGRRIAKIDGGWELLNYAKYRRLMDAEDQREKTAIRVRKHRERNAVKRPVTPSNGSNDIAKAKAEAKADTGDPPLSGAPLAQRKRRAATDGIRIPDDWVPDQDRDSVEALMVRLRAAGGSPPDALFEFRNHWRAVPGVRGKKLDWNATYANRLLVLCERLEQRPSGKFPIAPDAKKPLLQFAEERPAWMPKTA